MNIDAAPQPRKMDAINRINIQPFKLFFEF